jgi:hypothetical protein
LRHVFTKRGLWEGVKALRDLVWDSRIRPLAQTIFDERRTAGEALLALAKPSRPARDKVLMVEINPSD